MARSQFGNPQKPGVALWNLFNSNGVFEIVCGGTDLSAPDTTSTQHTSEAAEGSSTLLEYLSLSSALLTSAIVALLLCPVPRFTFVSPARALFLAVTYVVLTVGIGAAVHATCDIIANRCRLQVLLRRLLTFCAVAAWIAPAGAFYMRNSLWAIAVAFVLGALGATLIDRSDPEKQTELPQPARVACFTVAALLLQAASLFIVAAMPRPASLLVAGAFFIIAVFGWSASTSPPSRVKAARLAVMVILAIASVGASMTPYMAVPGGNVSSTDTHAGSETALLSPLGSSPQAKPGFMQSARSVFHDLFADKPKPGVHAGPDKAPSNQHLYPLLQNLFGTQPETAESDVSSVGDKLKDGNSTVLVEGQSYRGMILRPLVKESVTITPPQLSRPVLGANLQEFRKDPTAIPFYGAYWFFRTSDGTLPRNAVESRGDPTLTSFKTTDFTPMTMEARQNFGSLIDLSCCAAIEVIIANADRSPGTVAVELILTNTRLPGKPQQSLGLSPINSTLHWRPGDTRPPVAEVLRFSVPPQSALQSFDEAVIRFQLRFPRAEWSAKIGIEKFRLVPRGL